MHALVEEIPAIREGGQLQSWTGPREAIDWYWRPTNQVRAVLEALAETGVLGIARRDGNLRIYDLIERLVPPAILADVRDPKDQLHHRLLSRYRGNGLLGAGGQAELWYGIGHHGAVARGELRDELVESGALVPVRVDGFRAERFVVGDEVTILDQAEHEVAATSRLNAAERAPHSWRWIRSAGTTHGASSISTTLGRSPRGEDAGANTSWIYGDRLWPDEPRLTGGRRPPDRGPVVEAA